MVCQSDFSLCTPRKDSELHTANSVLINALLKKKNRRDSSVHICENNIMFIRPDNPLERDYVHLTYDGVAMVESNIKRSVLLVLGIWHSSTQRNKSKDRAFPHSSPRRSCCYYQRSQNYHNASQRGWERIPYQTVV